MLHRHPLTRLSLVAEERRMLVFVAFVLGCHVRQLGFMPDIKSFFFLYIMGLCMRNFKPHSQAPVPGRKLMLLGSHESSFAKLGP